MQKYCFRTESEVEVGDVLKSKSYTNNMVVTDVVDADHKYYNAQSGEMELENNSNFIGVDEDLKQVKNQDEKLTIIKGIILTHLTPSQMISLHDVIHIGVQVNLEYLKDHPEERGKAPDPETVMKRLFELD
jgi:hypothetical protein